jgi:cell wall assembly regulator SMI1
MSLSKKVGIASAVFIALALVFIIAGRRATRSFFYPKPGKMPPIVGQTTDELLARLQAVLEKHAPHLSRSLQPGISDTRIRELETQGKFQLSEELRAMYRWHNGTTNNNGEGELIPMAWFWPLDKAVEARNGLAMQVESGTAAQQAAFNTFAGHTRPWVSIFPDGAGDGYYFDPERNSFFHNFAETGSYLWFPSFKNFLAGVIECYESGAIFTTNGTNGLALEQDFDKTETIWNCFGAGNY